jgi:predicted MFS family arabinose efflux permease
MRNIDPVGQALAVLFLFGVVFGLIEGPEMGWTSLYTIAVVTVAAGAFVGFLFYEAQREDPFIDLRFFRSIPFASATMVAVCAFASYGAFLFMMSLYLQGERHYSAAHTGLIYLPIAIGALVFSPLSGRLVGRFGARPSLVVAGVMLTTAALLLAHLRATTPVWALVAVFAVFGIGFAMVNAPITTAAVSGMPRDRAGAASAVASTSRQVGVSIGVALCGSLAGGAVAGGAVAGAGADFAAAAAPLWLVCAGLGVVILVLALVSTSARAVRSAEQLAPLVSEPGEAGASGSGEVGASGSGEVVSGSGEVGLVSEPREAGASERDEPHWAVHV